jgi:hypothetical protein
VLQGLCGDCQGRDRAELRRRLAALD